MRKVLVLIAAVLLTSAAGAQVRINLDFNVDRQPVWGPTGYDHVEYYYLPDIDAYYNVPGQRFYYQENDQWVSSSSLPSRYKGFDLYHSYKVVVNDPTPYRNSSIYRDKYSMYKGRHDQQVIRDSREERYYVNPNHPLHGTWLKQQKHEKSNDDGDGKERNHGDDHDRK